MATMGERFNKMQLLKDPQDTKLCVFSLREWHMCVCECVCKPAADLTQLAQLLCSVKPRFTVCLEMIKLCCFLSLFMFAPVSSHPLRLKRLAKRDETTMTLPATMQALSLPGLPLKSFSRCHQFIPHSL